MCVFLGEEGTRQAEGGEQIERENCRAWVVQHGNEDTSDEKYRHVTREGKWTERITEANRSIDTAILRRETDTAGSRADPLPFSQSASAPQRGPNGPPPPLPTDQAPPPAKAAENALGTKPPFAWAPPLPPPRKPPPPLLWLWRFCWLPWYPLPA